MDETIQRPKREQDAAAGIEAFQYAQNVEARVAHLILLRRAAEEQHRAGATDQAFKTAWTTVQLAADFAASICGPLVLPLAQGAGAKADPLSLVAQRLTLARALIDTTRDSVIPDLLLESAAVAHGDPPQMFAARGKKSGGKYRLARHQLEALKWDQFLIGRGVRPGPRQTRLTGAYNLTWEAIRKWRKDCIAAFGDPFVTSSLASARELGKLNVFTKAGLEDGELWHDTLEVAAAAYYQELRLRRGAEPLGSESGEMIPAD